MDEDDDESFMRKFTLCEEDRRARQLWNPYWPRWDGGHRWFRSTNVVDLWKSRSQADKERICVNLLHHPAARYKRIKSA